MLDVEFSQFSDRGPVRERNEDYVGSVLPTSPEQARSHGWLFAVADGVGGHRQGDVASRTAVESVLAGFRDAPDGEMHTSLLPRLIQQANTGVHDAAIAAGHDGAGMATTLVLCALRYDRAVVAHVGDSRCYRLRGGSISLLTRDHTVANEQQLLGLISQQERENSRAKHVLSRSLGSGLFVSPDITEIQLLPGDVLVLCTDGMHNGVSAEDLLRIAGSGSEVLLIANQLAAHAMEHDGSDNVSVLVARIRGVERIGMYRGRPYTLR